MTTMKSPARVNANLNADDLALTFELAGVGLCIARERVIECCNALFGEMFGYRAEELAGGSMARLYPSRDEFEHTGLRAAPVLASAGRYSDERIMRRQDGTLFWCQVSGRAQRRDRPYACAVWTFADISAQRPVERSLTGREREVAQLLVAGKSSKEIGRALGLSPRTVDGHRARLLQKFDVKTRVALIAQLLGWSGLGARPPSDIQSAASENRSLAGAGLERAQYFQSL